MGKTLDHKVLFKKRLYFVNLIHSNCQIEIKTYQWFSIRVDGLPTNYTKPNIVFFQEFDKVFEQVGMIHSDCFPESEGLHYYSLVFSTRFGCCYSTTGMTLPWQFNVLPILSVRRIYADQYCHQRR